MKILIFLLMTLFLTGATCDVSIKNDVYKITVKSDVTRTPEAKTSIDIPDREPLAKDSYYNACIVYKSDSQGSTPCPNATVRLSGLKLIDDPWTVTVTTGESGCFTAKIPSDVNFTIEADDPREGGVTASYDGVILSARKGKLLASSCNVKMFPTEVKSASK